MTWARAFALNVALLAGEVSAVLIDASTMSGWAAVFVGGQAGLAAWAFTRWVECEAFTDD